MHLLDNDLYREDLARVAALPLPWDRLAGARIVLSGASGLIGSFLVDLLMTLNSTIGLDCTVVAIARNRDKLTERFQDHLDDPRLVLVSADVAAGPIDLPGMAGPLNGAEPPEETGSPRPSGPSEGSTPPRRADGAKAATFVIHAASNTHPVAYTTDPIGTITANVQGTLAMLELARRLQARRTLFLSTVEIYGEAGREQSKLVCSAEANEAVDRPSLEHGEAGREQNKPVCSAETNETVGRPNLEHGDTRTATARFTETDLGYIDCNTLRAGYPESKRTGEALCQAFRAQYGLDVVIPRLPRVFGPTMRPTDTKALSQFLLKAVAGEDIVLKSEGQQHYSYLHVADAVGAILTCLLLGEDGQAYNVADPSCDIHLKDLAQLVAATAGTAVVFDLPDETERRGFSTATQAVMDATKLARLGWRPLYDMAGGVTRTVRVLKAVASN